MRHIPSGLWDRLARLDGRFDFSMERRSTKNSGPKHSSGLNYARGWVVRLIEPERPERSMSCHAPCLADALEGAVAMAEERVLREKASAEATGTPPRTR